jgi:hypothetical protein
MTNWFYAVDKINKDVIVFMLSLFGDLDILDLKLTSQK